MTSYATDTDASSADRSLPAPRVSVIMIFLNARDYIAEAIESVCAQTLSDWELVLIDDGSSDGSRAIAVEFAARDPGRIDLYEHPGRRNLGTGPSRNLGMRMARGRYLCFLDADDVYEKERLERPVALLEADPALGVVLNSELYWRSWQTRLAGSARLLRLPDEVIGPSSDYLHPIPPPVLIASTLATRGAAMPGICSVTFRKAHVAGADDIPTTFVSQYEDQALIAKLLFEHPVLVLPDCLARYRQHSDSLTHQAMVKGEYLPGRAHPARRQFLVWLQTYQRERGIDEPLLDQAIASELASFDATPQGTVGQRIRRQARRALLGGANVLLPRRLVDGLIGHHLHRQRARVTAQVAERAAAIMARQKVRHADAGLQPPASRPLPTAAQSIGR